MIISLEERNVRSEQISIHIDNIKSIYSLVAVNIIYCCKETESNNSNVGGFL